METPLNLILPSMASPSRPRVSFGEPSGPCSAILIFATTWGLLVLRPSLEVPDYVRDLLFIIMGHYFAARRRSDPGEEAGPPTLFLPRGSVRLILVAGSVAVALVLVQRGNSPVRGRTLGSSPPPGRRLPARRAAERRIRRVEGPRVASPAARRGPAGADRGGGGRDPGRPRPDRLLLYFPPSGSTRSSPPSGPHRPIQPGTRPGGGRRVLLGLEVVVMATQPGLARPAKPRVQTSKYSANS